MGAARLPGSTGKHPIPTFALHKLTVTPVYTVWADRLHLTRQQEFPSTAQQSNLHGETMMALGAYTIYQETNQVKDW